MEEVFRSTRASRRLDRCSDLELLHMVRSLPRDSEVRNSACELLLHRYRSLIWSCVQRYQGSPESREDLMQVGYVGLLKAINNFDPAIGASLGAYAQPCIIGEIRRHFRDNRWQVHVRRSAQELRLQLRQARVELTQRLSRTPRDADLARYLNVSDDDLVDAQRADLALRTSSLDAPLSDEHDEASLADVLGQEDPRLELALDVAALWAHLGELSAREQELLFLRFYGNMTQAEIGGELGMSQMHVSRLLAHALSYLRQRILWPEDVACDHARVDGG
jgi:RNA polymerase sigma-B factor